LNILAYSDDIVLIGKTEIKIIQLFVETDNVARKLGLYVYKPRKTKYRIVERKNTLKKIRIFENKQITNLKILNT
jgi:hypothetical protein